MGSGRDERPQDADHNLPPRPIPKHRQNGMFADQALDP
jgi:hypothetical protein